MGNTKMSSSHRSYKSNAFWINILPGFLKLSRFKNLQALGKDPE